jgi:hypothetical protein
VRTRRRILLLGLALALLLASGVLVALLYPMPSEAERTAAKLSVGMPWEQACVLAKSSAVGSGDLTLARRLDGAISWRYEDGSALTIDSDTMARCVASIETTRPPSVHPLSGLRHTLARIIPALREKQHCSWWDDGY